MALHDFLVLMAKTFGLFWMMAFFAVALWLAWRPSARQGAGDERQARDRPRHRPRNHRP